MLSPNLFLLLPSPRHKACLQRRPVNPSPSLSHLSHPLHNGIMHLPCTSRCLPPRLGHCRLSLKTLTRLHLRGRCRPWLRAWTSVSTRALGQDATFGDSSTRQYQTSSASVHNDLPLSVLSSLDFASDLDLNVPLQGYPSFLSATPIDMFYCSPHSPSSSYSGSSLPPPDFASDMLNPWPGQGSDVGSHFHLAEPQHHLFGSLDVNPPCPWPSSSWSG
jgi:hypothetical protein